MTQHNNPKRVAILVADGFEQIEFTEPKQAYEAAGFTTCVVSPVKDKVQGVHHDKKGDTFKVDMSIEEALQENFDALLLPGGVFNPDALRTNKQAIQFAQSFFKHNKPVAAICHGPQLLINAEVVKGRQLTSYQSIRKDLENAGAKWTDQAVVEDDNLVTSRTPDDLKEFNKKIVEALQNSHQKQRVA